MDKKLEKKQQLYLNIIKICNVKISGIILMVVLLIGVINEINIINDNTWVQKLYITMISLLVIAVVGIIIFCILSLLIENNEKEIGYKYSQKGSLKNWYELTYKYNEKIKWLENIESLLKKNGVDLDKLNTIFSPSGCKGRYEKVLSKKYLKSRFIVTDIHIPEDHEISGDNYTFLADSNNAFCASTYLKQNNINNVDLIWDIKGAIWHHPEKNDLIELLSEYHEVLSRKGIILIDAYELSIWKKFLNYLFSTSNRIIGYGEESSFLRIKSNINEEIECMFDIYVIGKGLYRMAILSKRSEI
ncbi:hypothetical protein QCD85_05970 [Paenibacillus sp. PsM32]|uniref:hypothetical protein n=1 Tax=unclassified Paenibacillus TaxID=185978 RepID=UPI002366A03C|nr:MULTISPECIES: hypothetical protein [unclassified Paenibacillus]MDN4617636.1 hypothetical protein [Paenibacillus sp. PsM32]WDF52907.1 hypothetical protein PQ460_10980 [Paenibacillus sp. KACC 21273]